MARKAFILTYDKDANHDYAALHKEIIALPEVLTWFHYIKSSYILISNEDDATVLNERIIKILFDVRYLLVEVDLNNRNGRLPKVAWDWIKKQASKINN